MLVDYTFHTLMVLLVRKGVVQVEDLKTIAIPDSAKSKILLELGIFTDECEPALEA